MFEYLVERYDRIGMSRSAVQELEKAFCGENTRDDLPKMLTQSPLQSKELIKPNTQEDAESLDSASSCVCGSEKKKQRIGVRLSFSERQALEIEAKQIGLNLSTYIRRALISKNIAA